MGRVAETGDGSTLSLDFTTMSGTLDSRITFSRADATARATFINSSGYVETVATAQAPRFDFVGGVAKGLLLEAPATNLTINGQYSFGNNWGASGGINVNAVNGTAGTPIARINGPDNGTLTGTSITKDAGPTFVRLFTNTTVEPSKQYTYSLYVRAGTGGESFFRLATFDSTWMDTVGGCSDPTVTITNSSGNGTRFANLPTDRWVRVWVVFTTNAGQTSTAQAIYPNTDTSAATINYIWGAQIELGSAPSSVILTGATTLVRAVDTAIIAAGSNFSSWYTGGTTGTFVSNWYGNASSTTARSVIATSDQITKHLHMYQTPSALTLRLADFNAAATVTTANSLTANALTRGAFSYASTATSLCLNGGTVATGTLAFTVAPTWLSIGGPSTSGTSITTTTVMLNNSIRTLKYFPTRLSDAQIQTLTTP